MEPAWPAAHVGWVKAHTAPPIVVSHGEDSIASDVMSKSPQMIKRHLEEGEDFGEAKHNVNIAPTKIVSNIKVDRQEQERKLLGSHHSPTNRTCCRAFGPKGGCEEGFNGRNMSRWIP